MPALTRLLAGLALTASLAVSGLGFGAGAASATALPIGQCTTSSGVILAVDFSHWGGPLLRSCGSTPTTGYQLLNQGGWATVGTNHDGPAFICRIGYSGYQSGTKYPTPATEACNLTPPASAYWSYWHANPGQNTWSYSQLGAMSYKPAAGSVDLWIYGATNVAGTQGTPQITPDSVRAHNTTPTGGTVQQSSSAPTTPARSAPAGGSQSSAAPPSGPAVTSSDAGSDSGMNRHSATGSVSPSKPAAVKTPSRAATSKAAGSTSSAASPSSSSSGPTIVNAEPAADIKQSSGSVLPELITGALVLALGAGAGITGWRKRQAR